MGIVLLAIGVIGLIVVAFEAGYIAVRPAASATIAFLSISLIMLGLIIILGGSVGPSAHGV